MANQTFGSRVFRRGGSMAVTIKPALCRALGWTSGDSVIMCISGQHLIIRRVGRSDVLDTDFIPVGELPGKGKKNADQ